MFILYMNLSLLQHVKINDRARDQTMPGRISNKSVPVSALAGDMDMHSRRSNHIRADVLRPNPETAAEGIPPPVWN